MHPVGLAIIGLGRWANVLAGVYARSDNVRVITGFSRTREKREAFARRHGCGCEESLDAVLARSDVEAVAVITPNDQHAGAVERAARAGKHVYVEKPIAVSIAHANRIDAVIRETGVTFLCGHSARRLGGVRHMKRMIDRREIGDVSMVEAVFSNERGLELEEGDWRGDPAKAPGGPVIQLGVHQTDNLEFLLGPVARVTSVGKRMYTRVRNVTVSQTLLEFQSGQYAYLGANWVAPGVFAINVYGTKANLFYSLDFSWWSRSDVTDAHSILRKRAFTQMDGDPDNRLLCDTNVEFPPTDHLRDEIEEFALAIRGGGETEVGTRAATRSLAVALAAVKSSAERRAVEIQEILGK